MSPVLRAVVQAALFLLGSFCYTGLNIFSQLSKSDDGTYAYSLPSVVLTAEAVKLVLSWCFLVVEVGSLRGAARAVASGPASTWLAFAVPSVLYSVNNNLDMLNNQHMDPATEQVLVQLKILTTGLVWWLVFREPLGTRKWLALVLLFLGAAVAGLPSEGLAIAEGGKRMHIDTMGMCLVTVYVWISASAGVYNEWLYKFLGKGESIHVANIRLYTIGVLFNLAAHLSDVSAAAGARAQAEAGARRAFFHGYNVYVWALVANYALMGLLVAQVMKWFDNIVKLFISGASMYISAVLSWAIFGYAPTANFAIALFLVSGAMLLYNWERVAGAGKKEA